MISGDITPTPSDAVAAVHYARSPSRPVACAILYILRPSLQPLLCLHHETRTLILQSSTLIRILWRLVPARLFNRRPHRRPTPVKLMDRILRPSSIS
jgi:hypothetical protein